MTQCFTIRRPVRRWIAWLLPWAILAGGCGDDLGTEIGTEIGGVLVEQIIFDIQFELTGQPVCQGPPSRCGPPGIFALLVPDCPLGVVCFGESCNTHDRCYGTCGTSKDLCDNLFLDDLLATCSDSIGVDDPESDRCITLAYVYWQAVARYGQIAFDIAQDINCACLGVVARPAPKLFSIQSPEFFPYDDLDDDLMPDDWERRVGLNPETAKDAREDPDSDGILNIEEFILGTNPFAPDRYFPQNGEH